MGYSGFSMAQYDLITLYGMCIQYHQYSRNITVFVSISGLMLIRQYYLSLHILISNTIKNCICFVAHYFIAYLIIYSNTIHHVVLIVLQLVLLSTTCMGFDCYDSGTHTVINCSV